MLVLATRLALLDKGGLTLAIDVTAMMTRVA
jgi:hypothetical protein